MERSIQINQADFCAAFDDIFNCKDPTNCDVWCPISCLFYSMSSEKSIRESVRSWAESTLTRPIAEQIIKEIWGIAPQKRMPFESEPE